MTGMTNTQDLTGPPMLDNHLDEQRAWLRGERSCTNWLPLNPEGDQELHQIRVAQYDAAAVFYASVILTALDAVDSPRDVEAEAMRRLKFLASCSAFGMEP